MMNENVRCVTLIADMPASRLSIDTSDCPSSQVFSVERVV